MMKNITKSIFAAFLITVVTSCGKDFLEETPYTFISSEALYSTNSGLEAAIGGCYSAMTDYAGFGAGYPTLMTVGSGGYYTTQAPAADLSSLTFGGSTIWLTNNSPWDAFYSAINVANDIIEYAPKGGADDAVKTRIVGEAKLLRGMLYFNLVRMFGGVPLRTKPVSSEDTDLPRASIDDVYNLIIADLTEAKATMPAPGSTPKGRPNKFAASALLGKVYLALASNTPNSPNWQKAKDELLLVVNSNAYKLEKSSTLLFDINNENSVESIIEFQYSISGGPQGQFTNFFTPGRSTLTPLAQSGPFGRNRVNKEIFDRHKAQYPTDPRIDVNYVYGQFFRGTTAVKVYPDNKAGEGFPYIKKYVDPSFVSNASNRNFIYLRYADVLLMLAEIENEINGPANAYAWVNQVLKRARDKNGDGTLIAPTPADWTGLTQVEFRDRILRERRYELIGECHLWYDVRRKGKDYFFEFLNEHNNNPTLNLQFDKKYPLNERLMLFPIPDKEINANSKIDPKDQNPGYN
jgi:starch-binding outer membrane protein, SusD/RagB family